MTTETASTTADPSLEGGSAQPAVAAPPADQAPPTPPVAEPPKEDPASEPVVPEAYEFSAPDGVELDKAAVDEFSTIAKELKLTQEQAQKVADVAVKQAQRQREAQAKLVESWVNQVKADKDIGGDKLQENLAIARKALDVGPPELKELLNNTGLGNHPAVIKWAVAVGKALSEDNIHQGRAPAGSDDVAKKLFPSMN